MNKKNIYIHIDADAFFASVEQCLHRELKQKPIVAGRDGSIGVALSYEAKALGVKRALPIHIIRKEFPEVQMVASDYYMYRIFSNRMIRIIKEYIPQITRKSIDECSADITNLVDNFDEAYSLAYKLQKILFQKLDCTFSFGISSSPILAKMASGRNKPKGITLIDPSKDCAYYLFPIEEVPGLGKRLSERIRSLGVHTIGQYINEYQKIARNFSIVTDDIHRQLQGYPSSRRIPDQDQKSMNRSRSFKVTDEKKAVIGQMATNLEYLCRKMRYQNLVGSHVYLSLKNFERVSTGGKIRLQKNSRDYDTLLLHLMAIFDDCFIQGVGYRYVSVTISGIKKRKVYQTDMFGGTSKDKKNEHMYSYIDSLNHKFGKPIVVHADTLIMPKKLGSHIDKKTHPITEVHPLLPYESSYRRLRYPFIGKI